MLDLKGLSSEICWLEVVSFDRSLLNERRQDIDQILPIISHVKGPFKFPCHLKRALEINRIIVMSDIYIHSAVLKLTRMETKTVMETEMDMETEAVTENTQTWTWNSGPFPSI